MNGLIIKPKWADLILDGYKTIEIRSRATTKRETIGIVKSGTKKVFGTVELYDCIRLTREMFENLQSEHRLTITYDELLLIYPKPYGWFLRNVKKLETPKSYEHKLGSVIWVHLGSMEIYR